MSPVGRRYVMSDASRILQPCPRYLWLVLWLGLFGGTLAPGGVALATTDRTTPVVAPPEQVSQAAVKLAEARDLAHQDDHTGSVASYLEAFELDPSLVPRYADELGHQYNWNDQPELAIPWFEKRLEEAPGNSPETQETGLRCSCHRRLSRTCRGSCMGPIG